MAVAVESVPGVHDVEVGAATRAAQHRITGSEFAVQRRAPLVIPPDFALTPPRPGAPRPQEADSSTLALQAMFGGQAPRSQGEAALTDRAGVAPDAGIRSTAGDPKTTVVDKGGTTRDILTAPESSSPNASASVPK